MKVLITTEYYIPTINGVVVSTMNLKNELIKKGHEVRILTLSDTRHSYEKQGDIYIGSAGVQKVYPGARFTFVRNNRFIEELMNWHPDIIHSQSEFSTFFMARRIAKNLQIPIVHTYHTIYEDYTHYFSPVKKWGRTMATTFTNATLKHVNCIIAPSEKVKALLRGYGIKSEIKVIPTGIDIEKFYIPIHNRSQESLKERLGLSSEDKVLITVGRLAKEKNLEEILTFLKKLKRSDVKLVIVGDGPNRTSLEAYAKEMGINEQVIFTGMVSHVDIGGYYQIGDVFVSASNSETQGLTYFEALANGIPVICRKDECLANVVKDGVNGWQYETFEQFNEQVAEVLDHKASDFNRNAQESIRDHYSLDAFAQKVEMTYLETISTYREYQ
ncbi:MAG TPA: glycosyltransferase family 4 protein [Acholeplasmataceae bacterium]|nr:glycosyltransferase family 4 protein [Acholeplasmataceae bacterium]